MRSLSYSQIDAGLACLIFLYLPKLFKEPHFHSLIADISTTFKIRTMNDKKSIWSRDKANLCLINDVLEAFIMISNPKLVHCLNPVS